MVGASSRRPQPCDTDDDEASGDRAGDELDRRRDAAVAGLVTPRSGLAARHGISLVNSPGLIDPNYRGEIRIVLVNLGEARFEAHAGDRIAQLLLVPFVAPDVSVVDQLPPSPDDRGENGFGSSGR